MNLPNKLTLGRLCAVPVIMVFLLLPASLIPWQWAYGVGLLLFALTAFTDMLDGKIARARGLITDFGKFMDPIADKFMVIGVLLVMLFRMLHPQWYGVAYGGGFAVLFFATLVFIIFRELAITSLRLVLLRSGGMVVAANMPGKIKTVSQIVCICMLFIEPLGDALICYFDPTWFFAHAYLLSYLSVGVMLFFTLLSGILYIKDGLPQISADR